MTVSYGRLTPVFLRQVRVLNWHSIYDRTVDVPDTGLLIFGTNGSGKTSLQDAVQFGLFPDAGKVRFNAAVAGTVKDRTLLGYVLQGIENDAQGRPIFLHKERTTYVALLFERGGERTAFVVGVHGRGAEVIERLHLRIDGLQDLRELPLLSAERRVLPLPEFKRQARERRAAVYERIESYINDVSVIMGSPQSDWPQLLKSAIGFREITDATSFVRRFLGTKPIDHKTLMQTFEGYEGLAADAKRTEGWITLLEGAVGEERFESGRRLAHQDQSALVTYRYFRNQALMYRVGQAELPQLEVQVDRLRLAQVIAHLEEKIRSEEASLLTSGGRKTQIEASLGAIEAQIRDAGVAQAIQLLESKIGHARMAVREAEAASERMGTYLVQVGGLPGRVMASGVQQAIQGGHLDARGRLLQPDGVQRVSELLAPGTDVDLRRADGLQRMLDEVRSPLMQATLTLTQREEQLRTRQQELDADRAVLRRNRAPYKPAVEATRRLLQERLKWADARPLCEMIEVPEAHEDWRLAVEAELGMARFHFVVPPALFAQAKRLYAQYRKEGYPDERGQRQSLYGVRLVDVANIRRDNVHRADRGSLAERVDADGADAHDYVSYQLGRIACVYTEGELGVGHRRAVTPDLLFYHGYAVSSHDPARIEVVIGARARALRLAAVEQQLTDVAAELQAVRAMHAAVHALEQAVGIARNGFGEFRRDVEAARGLTEARGIERALRTDLETLKAESGLQELISRRDALVFDLEQIAKEITAHTVTRAQAEGALTGTQDQRTKAETSLRRAREQGEALLASYRPEEVAIGQDLFTQAWATRLQQAGLTGLPTTGGFTDEEAKELTRRIQEFLSTCTRQAGEREKEASDARAAFARIAAEYERANNFVVATVDFPEPLVDELDRLRRTDLPRKRVQLEEKAKQMREGVVQNVLHALAGRFTEVERLVQDINRSTEKVETRLGRFRLKTSVAPELKDIYELARTTNDTVLNIGQLAAESPDAEIVRQVDAFMQHLVAHPAERDRLCDYRNYLDFEVLHCPQDGTTWTPFRGTQRGGSGGERQVPFYVMTFALMDHVYREGAKKGFYLGRLLLLDEVFHNMSDDNVGDVMRLATGLGLQLIMVTPGKLRTLAPLFGKTLQAAKVRVDPREPTRFSEYTYDRLPPDLLAFSEYDDGEGVAA